MGGLFDRPMSEATIEGVSVQAAELLAPLSHGLQGLALAAALWRMGWGAGLGDRVMTKGQEKKAVRQTRRKAFRRWSERRDSNSRPPAPKADALPGCATLRWPAFYTLICQAPAFWRSVRFVIFHSDSDSAVTRLQPPIGAISMGRGALGWWLGVRYKMPVITAGSTPGATLLIVSLPE